MFLERGINGGHHLFHDALLDIDGFQETGEAGAEYVVHLVGVMYPH